MKKRLFETYSSVLLSEGAGDCPCGSWHTTTLVGRGTTATVATDAGSSVRSADVTTTSRCAWTTMTGEWPVDSYDG